MDQNPEPESNGLNKTFKVKLKNDNKLKVAVSSTPRRKVSGMNEEDHAGINYLKMETFPKAVPSERTLQEEETMRKHIGKRLSGSREEVNTNTDAGSDTQLREDDINTTMSIDSPLHPLIDSHKLYIVLQMTENEVGLPWYGIFDQHGAPIFRASTINRNKKSRSKSFPAPFVACCPWCFRKDIEYDIILYDSNEKEFGKVKLQPHKNSELPNELEIYLFGQFFGTIRSNNQFESQGIPNAYDILDGHQRIMGYCSPEVLNDALQVNVPSQWLSVFMYRNQLSTNTWTGMIRRNRDCTRQYELQCSKFMKPEQKLIVLILMMFLLIEDFGGYKGRGKGGR